MVVLFWLAFYASAMANIIWFGLFSCCCFSYPYDNGEICIVENNHLFRESNIIMILCHTTELRQAGSFFF